ncbi:transposase [Actinomadura sp. SCN-SB]|uniref:transposase n=1 Tax=Actinomadura sp. SCN-SB TaxID=3373092 RepID=UPI0037512C1D
MVSREIARHGGRGRYRAARAGRAARRARRRPKMRRMDVGACLRLVVVELLKQGWSPQQVAGRSPIDHPAGQHVHVSHEAIYGWIYALPKGGLGRWCPMLRSGRTRCRPVHGRAPRSPRIRGIRWIGDRSADAIGRQDPGHWGGGSPRSATTAGPRWERVSRFVVLVPPAGRDATTVSEAVIGQAGACRTWCAGRSPGTAGRHQREHQPPATGAFPRRHHDHRRPGLPAGRPRRTQHRPRAIFGFKKFKEAFAELLTNWVEVKGSSHVVPPSRPLGGLPTSVGNLLRRPFRYRIAPSADHPRHRRRPSPTAPRGPCPPTAARIRRRCPPGRSGSGSRRVRGRCLEQVRRQGRRLPGRG